MGIIAAVRSMHDPKAPKKFWGRGAPLSFPSGNDEWLCSDAWTTRGGVKIRCVVVTRKIDKYTGGKRMVNWVIPFDQLTDVNFEFDGWKYEDKAGA